MIQRKLGCLTGSLAAAVGVILILSGGSARAQAVGACGSVKVPFNVRASNVVTLPILPPQARYANK